MALICLYAACCLCGCYVFGYRTLFCGRTFCFYSLLHIFRVFFSFSQHVLHIWPALATYLPDCTRRHLYGNTPYIHLAAPGLFMQRFVCLVSLSTAALTHISFKMQKLVNRLTSNPADSACCPLYAADSAGVRMNALMAQSVINDVAALSSLIRTSVRWRRCIFGISLAEDSLVTFFVHKLSS